jgi:hypothetical protein
MACSTNGENCIQDIGGNAKGKGPLGRPRRRGVGVDDIKMDFTEIGWDGVNWIDLMYEKYKISHKQIIYLHQNTLSALVRYRDGSPHLKQTAQGISDR